MYIVHVHVHVKADQVEAFKAATIENAQNSRSEPGVDCFDILQQADDPARFVLVEIYKTTEAAAAHKETAHYKKWRDTVADMMAVPRTGIKYQNVLP